MPLAPRVLVTRPALEARRWVDALAARGCAAQALPLLEIAPLQDAAARAALLAARARLADYDALMFVSANAVRHFLEDFEEKRPKALALSTFLAIKTRAWVTGPGTVEALRAAGWPPARIDAPAPEAVQFDSEALWQQVGPGVRAGQRVLVVRGGAAGRDWLAAQLAAAGAVVDAVAAYQRCAPVLDAGQQALARRAGADGSVWLFSSAEAIANLTRLLPGADWSRARAVATHPRIARAARAAGFDHVAEARPGLDAVLASIEWIA